MESMKATTPGTVFQQLNELPAFVPTMGGQTPSGYNADANTGISALNLRGIGAQRVLILFDGHRLPPSTPDGFVNVNLMPQMLMQRVEVVTGGASAVYGSDAVSGVVNFIVDHKFNGLKVDWQNGFSSRSDDQSYQLGLAGGTDLFGGRGHIEASAQRIYSDGLPWTRQSRPDIYNWTVQGSGLTAADPYHLVQGVRSPVFSAGGNVLFSDSGFTGNFAQNGVLTPFNPSTDGFQNSSVWLTAQSKLDQAFARFDYNVSDIVHAYANVAASKDVEYGGFSPGVDGNFVFGACNAFLTAAQQANFGCTNQNDPNQPQLHLFKVPDPLVNLLKTTESVSTIKNSNLLVGLEGTLGTDYHWDSSVTVAKTSQHILAIGVDHDPPLFASMDAVVDPATGQIVCNVTLTNPGLYPGCVPTNFFGPSSESQAGLNYTFGNITREAINKTVGWDGTLRGTPFSTSAGPVGMAVSADVRRLSLDITSESLPDNPTQGCLGLRFGNCDPANPQNTHTWGNFVTPLPTAHQNAYEAAIEIDVPLLKDLPFAKSLSTNDAYRYTKYSNSGHGLDINGNPIPISSNLSAQNWKVGLVWELNDQLTVRATRSRDMRAPNLWDLFNPPNRQPFSFGTNDFLCPPPSDPLYAQCITNGLPIFGGSGAPTQQSGNPYLKPEIGNTITLGIVFRPTHDLSLSVDAYDIKVTNAITIINGFQTNIQQACAASGGSSPFCALQVRALGNYTYSPQNTVLLWYVRGVNVSEVHTKGIDSELNYHTKIAAHDFSLRALATYMPHLIYSEPPGVTVDLAGTNGLVFGVNQSPKWRTELQLTYNLSQGLDLTASERWRSAMRFQSDPSKFEAGHIASVAYTNVNASYALPKWPKSSIFLNIQNLFDKPPPRAGNVNSNFPGGNGDGWAIGDDVIGRYFTFGVRARF
jgi:outer membrane receptor protein involved in Fe transport